MICGETGKETLGSLASEVMVHVTLLDVMRLFCLILLLGGGGLSSSEGGSIFRVQLLPCCSLELGEFGESVIHWSCIFIFAPRSMMRKKKRSLDDRRRRREKERLVLSSTRLVSVPD